MSDRVLEINALAKELKANLKQFPNFPKEGILFEDFLPIFTKPDLFNKLVKAFKLHVGEQKIDYVIGLESRGFLFGPTLALALNAGLFQLENQVNYQVLPSKSNSKKNTVLMNSKSNRTLSLRVQKF